MLGARRSLELLVLESERGGRVGHANAGGQRHLEQLQHAAIARRYRAVRVSGSGVLPERLLLVAAKPLVRLLRQRLLQRG